MVHVMSRIVAAFIGIAALASPGAFPAHAAGPEPSAGAAAEVPAALARWTVEEVSGSVRYGDASAGGARAAPGDVLGAASTVETGPDGRATLVRGGDTVAVHPGSRVQVAPADADGLGARIRQTLGALLVDVEAVPGRSFTVETPRLVAGVIMAGTRRAKFSVEVSATDAAVSVHEGMVWVRRTDGGPTVEVAAGEMVRMAENGSGGTRGIGGPVFPDGAGAAGAAHRGPSPFGGGRGRSYGPRSPFDYTLSDLLGGIIGHRTPSPAEVAVVTLVVSVAATVLPRTATVLAALAGVLWWVAPAYVVGAVLITIALARAAVSGLRWRYQRQQRPAPEGYRRAW